MAGEEVAWTIEVLDHDSGVWERADVSSVAHEGDDAFTLTATIAAQDLVDVPLPLSTDVRLVSRQSPTQLYV